MQMCMSSGCHKWCISQLDLISDVLLMDSRGKTHYLKENEVPMQWLGFWDVEM